MHESQLSSVCRRPLGAFYGTYIEWNKYVCLLEDKQKEVITCHSVLAMTESCSMDVIMTVFISVTRQDEFQCASITVHWPNFSMMQQITGSFRQTGILLPLYHRRLWRSLTVVWRKIRRKWPYYLSYYLYLTIFHLSDLSEFCGNTAWVRIASSLIFSI